ncbi:hypothetical protein GF342_03560 [Candidatus Woesearchaeota archaeon]|nr:hypothetical protein [Candidatus Woesearchaeota archaeon]
MTLIHAFEGLRMFTHSLRVRLRGFQQYNGTAEDICRAIVKDCWNGKYFQTSTGHFTQFWTRDFGWCVASLLRLGYRDQAIKTLQYALQSFTKAGKITTAITPGGRAFDFPTRAVDTLPWLVFALAQVQNAALTASYAPLIRSQLQELMSWLDHGLVKNNLRLSSIKDHARRAPCCYDTCMLGMLSTQLTRLALQNPLKHYSYRQLLEHHFWTGKGYRDHKGSKEHSGDANLFAVWTGLAPKTHNTQVLRILETLSQPFPLKYTLEQETHETINAARLAPNYQGNTIWAHLGMIYLDYLRREHTKQYTTVKKQYAALIETHKTFLELYAPDGKPFKSPLYITDEGMLWASLYLA